MAPSAVDRWIGFGLCLLAVAAVLAWPRNLGDSDESLLLYETLRILRGEVYFAEIFNNIPPGAHTLFALAFSLFGEALLVARGTIALVQAAIVLAMYVAARQLGVRPGLAAACALAQLGIGQPAFPYASPHWLSTLLSMALLCLALRRPWARRPAGALWLGLVIGALGAVHHHKAVVMGAGAGVLLVADWLLDRRYRTAPAFALRAACGWTVVGALLVTVPFYGAFIARSGLAPFYDALIEFPLVHYRDALHARWGEVALISAHLAIYTWPRILAALPLALLPVAGRLAIALARDAGEPIARPRLALLIVALLSIASVRYYPDFIHLAFIASVLLVAVADDLEWLLARVAAQADVPRWRPAAAVGVQILLLAAVATQIGANLQRSHRAYAFPVQTPFGRVDLRDAAHVTLVENLQQLADQAPNRQLFVYPAWAALYLMTGTDNPTPFQILLPGYNPPEAIDASIAQLDAKPPPLVVVLEALVRPGDPLFAWVRSHYDPVGPPPAIVTRPTVYRRRPN